MKIHKHIKYILGILCIGILLPGVSHGQEFRKAGTAGFVFLEIPVSARYSALGETGLTLPDAGAEGLFLNPALMALNPVKISATFNYADWYVGTSQQAFGLTYRLPLVGTIGLQATYFNFGEIEKTRNPYPTEFGSYVSLGTFTAAGYTFGASFGRQLTDRFSFGASLKYVRESIDTYYADNVISDIGFIYFTGFGSLRIGTYLKNFGLESKYVAEKFKMPQQLRIGISGEVLGNFDDPNRVTLLAEANHPNDADERLQFGVESVWINTLVIRAGYKFGYDHEGLTLGAGLRFLNNMKRYRFDVAYMQHQYLGNTLRYTMILEF